jgi:porphobilinogen deaminase
MKQTTMVLEQLAKVFPDRKFEIVSLKTLGDKVLDVSLSKARSLAMWLFC